MTQPYTDIVSMFESYDGETHNPPDKSLYEEVPLFMGEKRVSFVYQRNALYLPRDGAGAERFWCSKFIRVQPYFVFLGCIEYNRGSLE